MPLPRRSSETALQRLPYVIRSSNPDANDTTSNPRETGLHTRGYLPHLKREHASYFVTFRLADSIPAETIKRLIEEQNANLRRIELHASASASASDADSDSAAIRRDYQREIERLLDKNSGACHLRNPAVAELTSNALRYFDNERYLLHEWVVMPNHVYVLLRPMAGHLLGDIVKSWKQFTARRAWTLLKMENPENKRFWQPESYDHWVRDEEERVRIVRYIRNNPVKARLCQTAEEWKWSSAFAGENEDAGRIV